MCALFGFTYMGWGQNWKPQSRKGDPQSLHPGLTLRFQPDSASKQLVPRLPAPPSPSGDWHERSGSLRPAAMCNLTAHPWAPRIALGTPCPRTCPEAFPTEPRLHILPSLQTLWPGQFFLSFLAFCSLFRSKTQSFPCDSFADVIFFLTH